MQTITWSVDGRYVVVGTYSYETIVWDTQEALLIFREGDLSGGGPGRVWLNSEGWMGDGASKLNAFTGETVRRTPEDNQYAFGGSAEGGTTEPRPDIAWGNDTGFLLIIDLNTTRGIQGFKVADWEPPASRRGIADISWNGTWNFIAAASRDGELYVAHLATSEVVTVLSVNGQLNSIDWNPQTNQIIYAGIDENGQPILSVVDVTGIGGVPSAIPTDTPPGPTALYRIDTGSTVAQAVNGVLNTLSPVETANTDPSEDSLVMTPTPTGEPRNRAPHKRCSSHALFFPCFTGRLCGRFQPLPS